jgi:uncharacterized membrane protein HdeD (DUF308 family)
VTKGIPITTRRGVQGVALVISGVLAVGAYFFATTGWGTPFPGCWPPLSRPFALTAAAVFSALAAGFLVAALRPPSGPPLEDRLLIGLALALFAVLAAGGGVHAVATGIARFGRSGCLQVGAPWSYASGVASILVGGIALWAATSVAARHE